MIRINLLPVRAAKKKEVGRQQLVFFAGVIFLAAILNGFWWWSTTAELDDRLAKETKLKNDIAQLERIIGEVNTISKDKKALEDKLAVLSELKKARTGPVQMLDALATVMPEKVWILSLDEKGGSLSLKGSAVSAEDIADLMRELKKSPFFQEPTLKKATQKDDKTTGLKFMEFEVTCGVSYTTAT
jgi:type IV pilus assembly protein PilN